MTQRALRIPRSVYAAAGDKGTAALDVLHVIDATLPAFTFANDTDGEEYLKPGAYCANAGNVENPELYASHPFPLLAANRTSIFGFADTDTRYFELYLTNADHSPKDPRAIGLATYKNRVFPSRIVTLSRFLWRCRLANHKTITIADGNCPLVSCGEWQEPMQAARLGMADEAKRLVQARFAMQDKANKQMRKRHAVLTIIWCCGGFANRGRCIVVVVRLPGLLRKYPVRCQLFAGRRARGECEECAAVDAAAGRAKGLPGGQRHAPERGDLRPDPAASRVAGGALDYVVQAGK